MRGTTAPEVLAEESTKDLVTGLLVDFRELAAAHAQSMSLEIRDELKKLSAASRTFVLSVGAFSVAGLLMVIALAEVAAALLGIPLWASYGGWALVFLAIGVILRRQPSPGELIASGEADLIPERGLERAKDHAQEIAGDAADAMRQ